MRRRCRSVFFCSSTEFLHYKWACFESVRNRDIEEDGNITGHLAIAIDRLSSLPYVLGTKAPLRRGAVVQSLESIAREMLLRGSLWHN